MQLNLYRIRVNQKAKQVNQLQKKNADIHEEIVDIRQQERQRERMELIKEVYYMSSSLQAIGIPISWHFISKRPRPKKKRSKT